jgi:hypothetical protein
MITAEDYLQGLAMLRVEAEAHAVHYPQLGVCGNLSRLLQDEFEYEQAYTLVEVYGAEWEHATWYTDIDGVKHLDAYFVPHNKEYGTWEGENLRMRLLLIDFLMECIQREIDRGVVVLAFD